jgi:phage gp36-like protein
MFPLPISTYIYIAIALGTAFITHRIDGYYTEKAKVEAIEHVIAVQTKVVNDQAVISQQTQKDKDDLQTRYDGVVAMLRGVHNPNLSTSQSTTIAIPSQGFRLLEPDAEVLVGFARQCAATEIERNDVINKYNALTVTK